jgi:hypothetical protein
MMTSNHDRKLFLCDGNAIKQRTHPGTRSYSCGDDRLVGFALSPNHKETRSLWWPARMNNQSRS